MFAPVPEHAKKIAAYAGTVNIAARGKDERRVRLGKSVVHLQGIVRGSEHVAESELEAMLMASRKGVRSDSTLFLKSKRVINPRAKPVPREKDGTTCHRPIPSQGFSWWCRRGQIRPCCYLRGEVASQGPSPPFAETPMYQRKSAPRVHLPSVHEGYVGNGLTSPLHVRFRAEFPLATCPLRDCVSHAGEFVPPRGSFVLVPHPFPAGGKFEPRGVVMQSQLKHASLVSLVPEPEREDRQRDTFSVVRDKEKTGRRTGNGGTHLAWGGCQQI